MSGCYCFCGLSWMVVFIIFSGVELVVVFVFLVLLNICVILGMFIISLLVFCSIFVVFVVEIFGSVDGIYNKLFLLICGKNFLLILLSGQRIVSIESVVISSVVFGQCSIFSNSG